MYYYIGFCKMVTCYGCNMCTGNLTDMYARAQGPQLKGECIHISQIKNAHVITVM